MLIDSPFATTKSAPRRRRAFAAAVALAILIPPSLSAAQTDDRTPAQIAADTSAARALATQGSVALAANKYADALDLVSRAEELLHAPTHLLMIARAQTGLGHLVAAKETYLKLLREELPAKAPDAFKLAQQEGKANLAVIDPKIGQLRITLEGVHGKRLTVKMDDQTVNPALVGVYWPVDPGKHEVVVYPSGQSPVKGSVEIKDGEKKELGLTIPEVSASGVPLNPTDNPDGAPPPDKVKKVAEAPGFFTPLRGVGLGLGVLGVAGVVVGSIFTAKGFSTSSSADAKAAACGKHCTLPEQGEILGLDTDAVSSKNTGVGILVGGGVALVAGVVLFAVGKPKAAPRPAGAYVTPWFGGNSAGLRGAF